MIFQKGHVTCVEEIEKRKESSSQNNLISCKEKSDSSSFYQAIDPFFLQENKPSPALQSSNISNVSLPPSPFNRDNIPQYLQTLKQSFYRIKDLHLYDLPPFIIAYILEYVAAPHPKSVSALLYFYVTNTFPHEAKIGIQSYVKPQISSLRYDFSSLLQGIYDFSDSSFKPYDSPLSQEKCRQNLKIENIPTWIWHKYVKEVIDIPTDQIQNLQGTSISILRISENYPEKVLGVIQALKGTNITDLYLEKIDQEQIVNIAQALKDTNIHHLILQHYKITGAKAIEIFQSLPNKLTSLDLLHNPIENSSFLKLAHALQNKNIKSLTIGSQEEDMKYIPLFAHALQTLKLKNLDILGIKKQDLIGFSQALKNIPFHNLCLGIIRLDQKTLIELLNALQDNQIYKLILITPEILGTFNEATLKDFEEALQHTKIRELDLKDCGINKKNYPSLSSLRLPVKLVL